MHQNYSKPHTILILSLKIKMEFSNKPEEKYIEKDKDRPFNHAWLDSSYFETLLPSTPWQNVR